MFGGARGGRPGVGGSGHGRDGGKLTTQPRMCQPESLVLKGGLGGTRKDVFDPF